MAVNALIPVIPVQAGIQGFLFTFCSAPAARVTFLCLPKEK
jgi:hypothetical protein